MVQLPTVAEGDTRDAVTATPLDDYELIDFGNGRKLERWGRYVVDRPDRLATGEPADRHWQADWVFHAGLGRESCWDAADKDLPGEWPVALQGVTVLCRPDHTGRVGVHGRDMAKAVEW